MSTSITPEERLLNLVIALMNTTSHMTRSQIVQNVAGYNPQAAASTQERMFERDKDTLRRLGLPLITVDGGTHATEIGYRIDKDSYGQGEFNFTPAQFSVLALAAGLWQENSALAADSHQAITKLRSGFLGSADTDSLAGLAPRLQDATGLSDRLIDAITERRTITFDYRAGNTGNLTTRKVQPWRVAMRAGAWYLIGFDLGRDAPRIFRFSRFEGPVKVVRGAPSYVIPSEIDVDSFLGQTSSEPSQVATLAIRTDRAQSLRLQSTPVLSGHGLPTALADHDLVHVPFTNTARFSEEIMAYAPAVIVLEPKSLRSAVLDRLHAAAQLDRLDSLDQAEHADQIQQADLTDGAASGRENV